MPAIQLERLKNDIALIEGYISKLVKRGEGDRVKKLMKKKIFMEERLTAVI